MANPKWVQNLWNNFGSKLRPKYQKIDSWELPWLRNICKGLWSIMDDAAKKAVYNLAMVLYQRYGKDKAEEIMTALKKKFDEII